MAKKKRRTKKIESSSKNKNLQQIQISLKLNNDSTETWDSSNSEENQQLNCLICARKINSSVAVAPFDEVFTFQILCQLFKILKISPAVCRFLLEDSLSTVKVQFCESCDETITHCLKVSQEIDNLRNVLEESTIKLKEDIIEGYYCRPDPDLSQRTNSNIRKTLVQCWTTCQVKIKKLPPSIFESRHNAKFTNKSQLVLPCVKQEICDDNEVNFTEGPTSPSSNENVKPQTQKDVETEGNTSDNDFDGEDIEPPCSPIPATLSDESDTQEIDDPLKEEVLSEAPCSPFPPILRDESGNERVDDLSKEEANADANSEKDGNPNIRRSVRNHSAKKKIPLYSFEIESEENASETGSIYSPDSPFNDESALLVSGEMSPKIRRRQTKTQAKGRLSRKNKNPSKSNVGKSGGIRLKRSIKAYTDTPEDFPYNCQTCNKGFVRECHFQYHSKKCLEAVTGDGLKFPCDLCPKSNFTTPRKLKAHKLGVHKIRNPKVSEGPQLQSFLCTYCNKSYRCEDFKISAETEADGGAEGDLSNIPCDLPDCEKQFSNFYLFSVHHIVTCPERLRLIAENPNNNKDRFGCVRTYYRNSKSTNETTGDAAAAGTDESTDPSTNTATDNGVYSCKTCACKFRNLDLLAVHEKRHSGRVDISCPQCDLKFVNVYLTRSHQIRVHGHPTKSTYDAENQLDSFECVWCNQFFLRSNYWVTENENSNENNDGDPTLSSSSSPPKQVLRIPIKKSRKSSLTFLTNFQTFLWCHRRYCIRRPVIQIREGVPERRNKVLMKTPRKYSKSKLSSAKGPGPEMETETRTVHSCDICGKSYYSESFYRAHLLAHRQDIKYNCPECHQVFETAVQRSKHYFANHCPKSKLKSNQVDFHYCFRCDKKIEVNFELNAQGNKLFPCIYSGCKSKSLTVEQHRLHHARHHSDCNRAGVKYFCNACKKFFKPDDVRVKLSEEEDKFQCTSEECKRLSKDFRLWGEHHRRHHLLKTWKPVRTVSKFNPKTSICKICNKIFSRASACQHHMITAHTKQYPFYCEVCGEGQPSISKLKDHSVCHSTERPFKCEQCPRAFKSNYQLKGHMNFHNKIYPYVCEVCGKAFHRTNNLYMHKKHSHKI